MRSHWNSEHLLYDTTICTVSVQNAYIFRLSTETITICQYPNNNNNAKVKVQPSELHSLKL